MAVQLNYVSLQQFDDVMPVNEQAASSDDMEAQDPNQNNPTRDDAMVKRFLKRAEHMAESYLSGYELPLPEDQQPHSLKYAIYVMARYYLLERGDGSVSDNIQESYDQVMSWLKMVSDGEIRLGGAAEEDLTDFVGLSSEENMVFAEMPFVDMSATVRNEPI